jgi:HrpA-like RNA helicase
LLRANQEGAGYDALCIVAMSSVAGSIFYHRNKGTEEEKLLTGKNKVQLCHKIGDSLTNLNVFQAWLKNDTEKDKTRWCKANGINFRSMLTARDALNEIHKVLCTEVKVVLELKFCQPEVQASIIPRLILECFASNLARFTGHKERGYYVINKNECLILHPSSSLAMFGGTLPKWIVFEQEISTSRHYILNATEIAESDVVTLIQRGIIRCDMRELESKEISPFIVETNLGKTVVRNLIGREGKGKRTLEENIEQIINRNQGTTSSHCVLEFTDGKLIAFCAHSALPIVKTRFKGRLGSCS